MGDKIKGGAVKDDKSPLKEAIDFKNEVQDDDLAVSSELDLEFDMTKKYTVGLKTICYFKI